MIALVEGAARQKTPNEIALEVLLISLTALFLLVVITLPAMAWHIENEAKQPGAAGVNLFVLTALLVCLIPTTIGGLLSAIGISGMDRLVQRNVFATSGRAVEAAGDIDVLLLDKTGTITLGNRMATEFIRRPESLQRDLPTSRSWLRWPTKHRKGVPLSCWPKSKFGLRGRELAEPHATFVPFSAKLE